MLKNFWVLYVHVLIDLSYMIFLIIAGIVELILISGIWDIYISYVLHFASFYT